MSDEKGARRDRKGILVVDDEKLVRWSIREALRGQYRVWTAESAEKAMRMMREWPKRIAKRSGWCAWHLRHVSPPSSLRYTPTGPVPA